MGLSVRNYLRNKVKPVRMPSFIVRIKHYVGETRYKWLALLLFHALSVQSFPVMPPENDRQSVAGTWCSVEVPQGWVPAKKWRGFEHDSSGSSLLFSLQGSDFESNKKVLTVENFKKQGVKLLESRELLVQGRPAMFYRFDHDRKGKPFIKQMVLMGDQYRTVSVSAFCPASDSVLINSTYAALMSVKYDPADYTNLTDEVPFQLSFEGTDLRPVILQGNGLAYTADGYFPTRSDDKASFLAGRFSLKDTIGDLQSVAIQKIKGINGVDSLAVFNVEPVIIDGLSGFVLRAQGAFPDGTPQQVHAAVLFVDRTQVFILAGMASGKANGYPAAFQKMTASFKRR